MESFSTESLEQQDDGSWVCVKCKRTRKTRVGAINHSRLGKCGVRRRPSVESLRQCEDDSWLCVKCNRTFDGREKALGHLALLCHVKPNDRSQRRKKQVKGWYNDPFLGQVVISQLPNGGFPCPRCQKLFSRIDSMRRHVDSCRGLNQEVLKAIFKDKTTPMKVPFYVDYLLSPRIHSLKCFLPLPSSRCVQTSRIIS